MFSPAPTSKASKWIGFVICLCLVLACAWIFYDGFFPTKVVVPGEASHSMNEPAFGKASFKTPHNVPSPKFKKIIFMLVDSLRSDFISSKTSGFTFVRSLLEQGKAYAYKAHAHPPTVTLPRVKAIVTGGIPSFSDYLNNFQSSALNQDNIVWQMQKHSKCIAFYGDDTWVRLFPSSFSRYEGTTSFFVQDTVIVDYNVTRNLGPELDRYRHYRKNLANDANTKGAANGAIDATNSDSKKPTSNIEISPESPSKTICQRNADWDVLILHYLGLDHIGHLQGPLSPLMHPKQVEMNGIFERIYKELGDDTILIMSGDHGMNADGAHGGPSEGETSPALIFASPRFDRHRGEKDASQTDSSSFLKIDQIDLVPTLSTLFGLPTPLNSVGKLIPDLMKEMYSDSPAELLRAYQLNANHIHRLLKTSASICEEGNIKQYYDSAPCVGVSHTVRNAIDLLNEAKHTHESYSTSGSMHDYEQALHNYQTFLSASSLLFAHALSEYDDYLLFSAMAGFAIATIFAALTFYQSLKQHPPLITIISSVIIHGIADWFLLAFFDSSLATFGMRFFVSLTAGYCLAHIFTTLKQALLTAGHFLATEVPTKRLFPAVLGVIEKKFGSLLLFEANGGFVGAILLLAVVIRPIAYSSSSFIEEEHMTFLFMAFSAMLALLHYIVSQSSSTSVSPAGTDSYWSNLVTIGIALVTMRAGRLWNNSGLMSFGKPDMAQLLNRGWPLLKHTLVILTFVLLLLYVLYHVFRFLEHAKHSYGEYTGSTLMAKFSSGSLSRSVLRVWTLTWLIGWLCTFLFQLTGSHTWAMLAHYGYFLSFLIGCFWFFVSASRDSALGDCLQLIFWTIFGILLLLARYHNVPMLGIWFFQAHCMVKLSQGYAPHSGKVWDRIKDWMYIGSFFDRSGGVVLPFWVWSYLTYYLGQYAYFSQGNSNSLASIDIAGAYAGLSGYQDSLVGFFVALLLYSGPLIYQFALMTIFVSQEVDAKSDTASLGQLSGHVSSELPLHLAMFDALKSRLASRTWAIFLYSIFIMLHRGHLFIWSVFAPKLLYEMLHTISFFLQTLVYFAFAAASLWFVRRQAKVSNKSQNLRHL